MIVQTYMVILTLSVGLISDAICASFSNVYVESDVAPVGYYSYGIPYPSIANPRLSQINSLPSVPGYVTIHPTYTAASENLNPNVVAYHAPSAPVVIAPTKQEPTGYEYSYVVYDQNTGDHKAQRELSDGSVVRGEYSFLQPDGYVREVQYIADDVSGFNAVVKKFLPADVEGSKKSTTNEHKESPPCHDIKSESLKEGSEKNSGVIFINHKTHSSEESNEKSKKHTQHSTPKENNNHSKTKVYHEEENSKENHHLKLKHSNEESHEKTKTNTHHTTSKENNHHSKPKESHEEENSKEKHNLKPKHAKERSDEENHHSKSKKLSEESSSEESEEVNHKSKESAETSIEKHHKKCKTVSKESEEESEEETESEESKENLRKISSKEIEESKENNKQKTKKESKESSGEDSDEESEKVSHGKHQEAQELLKPSHGAVVPYKDLIRCIEAAMRRNNGVPAAIRQEHSPLTYIVLNKPC